MKLAMKTALQWQWENSSRKAQALCGRVPISKDSYVSLFSSPSNPIISGLMRCSSPSACVVCSSRIAKARGTWLSEVFDNAVSMGYEVSMLTLTVRHRKRDRLEDLLKAMEQAYTNVQGSTSYKILRKEYSADFVRVLEVTHGKNGFHPHFHIAIIHKPGFDFEVLRTDMERTWVTHIEKQGLLAPVASRAVNVVCYASNSQRAWYLTKASGASSLEFTGQGLKQGREDNLGIWQVHALAVAGDMKAKFIWHAYERGIFKKRLFTMSKGMAEKYGVIWRLDQEIASDEVLDLENSITEPPIIYSEKASIKFVGAVSATTWKAICERRLNGALYDLLREESPDVPAWLAEVGIHGNFFAPEVLELRSTLRQDLTRCLKESNVQIDRERFDYYEDALKMADCYEQALKTVTRCAEIDREGYERRFEEAFITGFHKDVLFI